MQAILAIARAHDLRVVQDAAQSVNASYRLSTDFRPIIAGPALLPQVHLGGAGDQRVEHTLRDFDTADSALERLFMCDQASIWTVYDHAQPQRW